MEELIKLNSLMKVEFIIDHDDIVIKETELF
jgi:hypothetical protein